MRKGDFITSIAIVLIAILIILSFFVGGKEKNKIEKISEEKSRIEKINEEKNSEEKNRIEKISEEEEGSNEPSSLISKDSDKVLNHHYVYNDTELQDGKEKARLFIKHILNYDHNEPTKYTQLKTEITDIAFSSILKTIEQIILDETVRNENIYPINNVVKRSVIETSVIESDFYNPAEMYINIKAILNTSYLGREVVEQEEMIFNVFLEKALHGEYKVSSIYRF